MLRAFRGDPRYLLNYYRGSTLALSALLLLLLLFPLHRFPGAAWAWTLLLLPLLLNSVLGLLAVFLLVCAAALHFFQPSPAQLALVPLGVYFGMLAVQLIHNCAHKSFRPRWLNRPLGELLALHLLSGFPGFVILHLTHHQYPDHPELDPHPNGTLTFWQYFFAVKGKLKNYFQRTYSERWKDLPEAEAIWAQTQLLLRFNRFLRAAVLLALAGPLGFALFLVPSFIANHLTFAHINFFTHQRQPDGSVEVVNLTTGIYAFLNPLMLGGYSHRNHHLAPHLFNPTNLPEQP
jgi:fatty acid desaturase